MCRARWILIVVVLISLPCVAGKCNGGKDDPVIIPPDWNVWSDPGLVLALDETDPQGDDWGYGEDADLSEMKGTFDSHYAYISLEVYASSGVDLTGDTAYGMVIDADNNGDTNTRDIVLWWDGFGGFDAWTYDGGPVGGVAFQLNSNGGIDFAISLSLVDQSAFGVSAGVMRWDGYDYQEGDCMPPDPQWATFSF